MAALFRKARGTDLSFSLSLPHRMTAGEVETFLNCIASPRQETPLMEEARKQRMAAWKDAKAGKPGARQTYEELTRQLAKLGEV